MKTVRYIAWAIVAILIAFVGYATLYPGARNAGSVLTAAADIGGPFSLLNQDGQPMDQTVFEGKPYVLFFGFTNCPEICPTSLYEMAGWIEKLGTDAQKLNYAFVTVDPERDTPDVLKEYVEAFSDKIIGMTGTVDQVDGILKAYRVYARRVPLEDDDYTMDHTASIYLMRADGTFQGTIAYGEDSDTALKKLQNLSKSPS